MKRSEIKRTFEFIEYALANHPKEDQFSVKKNGRWEKNSTKEIKENADKFSSALISLGFFCREWGPDTGELSPTLKLKRDFLVEKYKGKIEYLYGYTEKEPFLID